MGRLSQVIQVAQRNHECSWKREAGGTESEREKERVEDALKMGEGPGDTG